MHANPGVHPGPLRCAAEQSTAYSGCGYVVVISNGVALASQPEKLVYPTACPWYDSCNCIVLRMVVRSIKYPIRKEQPCAKR